MNERPAADYVFFGVIFLGFAVAGAAIIIASLPAAILGAVLEGAGLRYFLFRQNQAEPTDRALQ
jgi:hypothetical protein